MSILDQIKTFSNPAAIQATLDAEVQARGLGQYVEYIRYVPQGQTPPDDATHVLELRSLRTTETIQLAMKAPGLYGLLADALLAIL